MESRKKDIQRDRLLVSDYFLVFIMETKTPCYTGGSKQ